MCYSCSHGWESQVLGGQPHSTASPKGLVHFLPRSSARGKEPKGGNPRGTSTTPYPSSVRRGCADFLCEVRIVPKARMTEYLPAAVCQNSSSPILLPRFSVAYSGFRRSAPNSFTLAFLAVQASRRNAPMTSAYRSRPDSTHCRNVATASTGTGGASKSRSNSNARAVNPSP